MDYLFVHFNGGWWLKIQAMEQLIDYHSKTDYRWERAFKDYCNVVNNNRHHTDYLSEATYLLAGFHQSTFINELTELKKMMVKGQIDQLNQFGCVFINDVGGYYHGKKEYSQFVRRKELLFPSYKKENIRIKQWDGGTHFYAYIGDLQLKDGDKVKWDTREEAMKFAEGYITNQK